MISSNEFVFDFMDIEAVAALSFGSLDDISYACAETDIICNLPKLGDCIDIADASIVKACK